MKYRSFIVEKLDASSSTKEETTEKATSEIAKSETKPIVVNGTSKATDVTPTTIQSQSTNKVNYLIVL